MTEDSSAILAEMDDLVPAPNKSLSLMLHCGGKYADWETVKSVPCPAPTRTYYPMPHHEVFDAVRAEVTTQGGVITQSAHALSNEGARYFALMEVQDEQFAEGRSIIGIQNGHDRKISFKFSIGSKVFACDNLALNGKINARRNHSRFLERDLPGIISESVHLLKEAQLIQAHQFRCYKHHTMSQMEAHDSLIKLLDAEAFPKTKITDVLGYWREDNRWGEEPTMWRMFNAVTASIRGQNLWTLGERTTNLHTACDDIVGVDTQHVQAYA